MCVARIDPAAAAQLTQVTALSLPHTRKVKSDGTLLLLLLLASLRAGTTLYSGGQVGAQAASTYIHLHLLCPCVTMHNRPSALSQRLSRLGLECMRESPVRHCSNEHRRTRENWDR